MSHLKTILIILGLTIFFLIDELLIVILGKGFEIWSINLLVLLSISVIALALNVILALVVYRAMIKKPTTGQEGMIGEQGTVISTIDKDDNISIQDEIRETSVKSQKRNAKSQMPKPKSEIKVSVHGEIWQAESEEILHKGEKVIVQKVVGLKLLVRRSVTISRSKA